MPSNLGSTWSKWDLHIHTPASHVQSYGNSEPAWQAFLADIEALPPEFTTLGINDYLTVDGYRRLREEKAGGRLGNVDLLLPVVELRISRFAGQSHWRRVNFHVVFSDEVGPEAIEQEFLSTITASYQLAEGTEWSGPPLPHRLEELGRMVKGTAPDPHAFGTDLQTGIDSFNVDPEIINRALSTSAFRGKYLTAIGKVEWDQLSWTAGSAAEKRSVIERADFLFTACATPAEFETSGRTLRANKVHDRLLHCSDAHALSTSAEVCRVGNCFTWVKARPSFEGLLLARHEYAERVFVGDEPPQLRAVRENPTRYVSAVELRGKPKAPEAWFPGGPIPLNPGLVAVIGNKGGGKSALTDAIAVASDADVGGHLSFLNTRRFLHPLSGRGGDHECIVTWVSGESEQKSLDAPPDESKPERVKYLPQNYFERLCSEVGDEAYEEFEHQLKQVVFTWLPEDRRLGETSLDGLIGRISAEWRERHRLRKNSLVELNIRIAAAERSLEPEAVSEMRNKLAERERELAAHDEREPVVDEIPSTADPSEIAGQDLEEIRSIVASIDRSEQSIAEFDSRLIQIRRRQQAVQDLMQRVSNIEYYVTEQLKEPHVVMAADELGLDVAAIVTLGVDRVPLQLAGDGVSAELQETNALRDAEVEKRENGVARRELLVAQLDEKRRERKHQEEALDRWRERREEIVGRSDVPGSLEYMRARIDSLPELAAALAELERQREQLLAAIYNDLAALRDAYRELFEPVQLYLDSEMLLTDELTMRVDTVVRDDGFARGFGALVDRSKRGSFFQASEEDFADMTAGTEFNDVASTRDFVRSVMDRLRPTADGQPVADVDWQMRAGSKREEAYDFVFGLEYLRPHYALRFNGKEIAQLSPGERGAALLIFYLLVDRSHVPILLDQPEENLDNETVTTLLVPAMREARRRRQVIVVTHNPNLAVYCDADQVVLAELSRGPATRITYRTGAIEDVETRRWLVNVLEGTGKAFLKRHDKYSVGAGGELVLRSV